MVCLSGTGVIQFDTGDKFSFAERDLVYIPKGVSHTITSPDSATEYFFIRLS
jgi:mannose-6-phosphate isomerase-like protein (cupin superfamily)